jgi:hypothetical protein
MTWLADYLAAAPDWPEPDFPCREMPTRACPESYAATCGPRPCARFESDDESPWLESLPKQ